LLPHTVDVQLGETPLHLAVMCEAAGSEDAVRTLVEDCGADLEARDQLGQTPLHVAVSRNLRGVAGVP
jgi:ankyrin repeat protein